MARPTYDSQQMMVRRIFGIPIVMARFAVPSRYGYDWEWGRWHFINPAEEVHVNCMLKETWK